MQRTIIVEHNVRHIESRAPIRHEENLFVIKCPKGLAALRYWLQKRKYNTFVETQDVNNKPMFGLLWDYHLGQFPSPKRTQRGAIVILDAKLQKAAAMIVLNWLAAETAYGEQWRTAQREIWKHGRT